MQPEFKQVEKIYFTIKENISISFLPSELYSRIKKDNTFLNPKYETNMDYGYSNEQIPSTIETYQTFCDKITVSRGYLPNLLSLIEEFGIEAHIEDSRAVFQVNYPALNNVTLRPYQLRAVNQAMKNDQGVIVSPTGSGKSLIGLEIIRQRKQKALIIVHRSDLARQWIEIIKQRMGITAGFIGDGQWKIGEEITVGMVQTLASQDERLAMACNTFGLVLCDETHHAPAEMFSCVLGSLNAKYRYGLSATVNRRDGLERVIYRTVGPVIETIQKDEVENIGATVPVTAVSVNTNYNPGFVSSWNEYLNAITESTDRNLLIIDLATKETSSVLILCDRIEHTEKLSEMMSRRDIDHVLVHGKLKAEERAEAMSSIKTARITIGTTGLLGEGLDVARWSALIMASPISSEIKLMQAIGRVVRPFPGKEGAIVYDLKDNCGFAGGSFKSRFEIYKKNKIWVRFPKK